MSKRGSWRYGFFFLSAFSSLALSLRSEIVRVKKVRWEGEGGERPASRCKVVVPERT